MKPNDSANEHAVKIQACAEGVASGSNGPRGGGLASGWLASGLDTARALARSIVRQSFRLISPHSLWGPPLIRTVLSGLLLSGVAYLGHLSSRLDQLGPVRVLDEQIISLAERVRAPEQGETSPSGAPTDPVVSGAVQSERAVLLAQSQTQAEDTGSRPGCPELKSQAPQGITAEGLVILNEANVDELSTLPGIGKSRATAIVELRKRLRGLKKVADLLRIKGIGWKSLVKLKEKVVLNRPAPAESTEPEKPSEPSESGTNSISKRSSSPGRAGSLVASMGSDPLH